VFTKKEPFIKQVAIYLSNGSYQEAYDLSKEFSARFPDELVAHFLLAKSAYWVRKYDESKIEARKAFNMAVSDEDIQMCAILASSAYYRSGEYAKGYELLKGAELKKKTPEIVELLFIFSVALQDEGEAMRQIDELQKMDKKLALEFIKKYVGN
jgi:hypothetical protein